MIFLRTATGGLIRADLVAVIGQSSNGTPVVYLEGALARDYVLRDDLTVEEVADLVGTAWAKRYGSEDRPEADVLTLDEPTG